MEFIWNDGGRAASGYVGLIGDCVTRSISIASGRAYRDVYNALGERALKSPRNGVRTDVASNYLAELGWIQSDGNACALGEFAVPKGVVVAHLASREGGSGHFCAVIDHVIYDTWNPSDEEKYEVRSYWMPPVSASDSTLPVAGPKRQLSQEQELTQREFDKIMRRLRALDKTASNNGSTEGEKRNALRMMQSLMLTHNLSRDDIVGDDNIDNVQFARMACPLNGRRACGWEKQLAFFVAREVFPTVQWYHGTRGHRTMFWFYGPVSDVQNCIELFRELLLTIAAAAQLQYCGHVRGSGASYAEGYVSGLPRSSSLGTAEQHDQCSQEVVSQTALIQSRTLALHDAAKDWLHLECGIRLEKASGRGRNHHDPSAASRGKVHGSKHEISVSGRQQRITHRPG